MYCISRTLDSSWCILYVVSCVVGLVLYVVCCKSCAVCRVVSLVLYAVCSRSRVACRVLNVLCCMLYDVCSIPCHVLFMIQSLSVQWAVCRVFYLTVYLPPEGSLSSTWTLQLFFILEFSTTIHLRKYKEDNIINIIFLHHC